jgi:hypothetical protein
VSIADLIWRTKDAVLLDAKYPDLGGGDVLISALVIDELATCSEEWSKVPFLSLKSVRLKRSGLLGGALGIKGDGASMLPRKADGVRVRFRAVLSGEDATSSG